MLLLLLLLLLASFSNDTARGYIQVTNDITLNYLQTKMRMRWNKIHHKPGKKSLTVKLRNNQIGPNC